MNQIICGDSTQELKKLSNNYIDLTVTSPPYDDLRHYNEYFFNFEVIVEELYRVTKNGGVCVWVVNDSVIDNSETLSSFRQALYFKQKGWNVHDTMIYAKKSPSLPDPTRYYQAFQYMFIFSKGKPKTFNPIKDRKNKYAGSEKSHYIREADGSIHGREKNTIIPLLNTRYNVWEYATGYMLSTKDKIAFKHPAIMPEQLAKDHIISWSNEGDLVLDPFAGSGTTLKMAKLNNRNYLGIEISEDYCDLINQRLSKYDNEKLISYI